MVADFENDFDACCVNLGSFVTSGLAARGIFLQSKSAMDASERGGGPKEDPLRRGLGASRTPQEGGPNNRLIWIDLDQS